ncbi:MAG: SDR family NAD(P)-dependent oxidoreductase, partial [Panacagrimonas sp.]
ARKHDVIADDLGDYADTLRQKLAAVDAGDQDLADREAALAQAEAALEIFRAQNAGHLVGISSVSAMRGMKGAMSIYAASKAGMATLFEGIRADLLKTPIKVSTIYPGYILTPLNEKVKNAPFRVDVESGCRSLVRAIEKESPQAIVPPWPWTPISSALRHLPLSVIARNF